MDSLSSHFVAPSLLLSNYNEEIEDLKVQLKELDKEVEILTTENEIFETYYNTKSANDPQFVEIIECEELLSPVASPTNGNPNMKVVNKKYYQQLLRKKKTLPTALQSDQKCHVLNFTLENLQKQAEESITKSEKYVNTIRACLEETDLRIKELKRDAYEFKRDVVVGGENVRTGKTIAEKALKYMEETLKSKDALMEKMRLKNATVKGHIMKAEHQLNQKEEMGDMLHYIDFHQLQIENKQYVMKIEELNTELKKLKQTTAKTLKALSEVKIDLDTCTKASDTLAKEISNRQEQYRRITDDTNRIRSDLDKERKKNKFLKSTVDTSNSNQNEAEGSGDNKDGEKNSGGMPQILDYVAQKAQVYELNDIIKNWKKKVELAEYGVKKASKELKLSQLQNQQGGVHFSNNQHS